MEHNEDLARLEQFVEKLINSHNQLKKEKNKLLAQVQKKQQEIAELQELVKNLQKDRNVMHTRVSGLIDRINEWEKMFEQEGAGQSGNAGKDQAQKVSNGSASLFNVTSEQPL